MRSITAKLAARLVSFFMALLAAPTTALSQGVASIVSQSQDITDRIRDLLATGAGANVSIQEFDLNVLRAFYSARAFQPAWTGSPAAQANANLAVSAIEHAGEDGLQPDRYHLGEIDLHRNAETVQAAAEYELLLTDGMLHYARDLRLGQGGLRELDDDVGLPPDAFDPSAALDWALRANRFGDFLASLPPPHAEYRNLKTALARDRAIGGSADSDTASATERSEKSRTPAAGVHAQEIIANMERWRWAPRSFGARYVSVNVAGATLEVIDHGKIVLTSPVIVGKPETRTPIFSAVATGITFNPSWHVPTTIIRHEILPRLRGTPNYLARKHMVRGEGGGIRQLPGPGNALGRLKFEMPNEFDAYLHDTPLRSLFAKDERHLSHGCIRVGEIQPLASFALTNDVNSGLERIRSLIMTRATRRISLDEPLPVFVMYWTVIADADGAVNVLPDVYGRDQRLIAALAAQRLPGLITMNIGTRWN